MWSRLNVTSGRARGPVAGLATPPLDQLPPGLVTHSVVVRRPQVRRIIVLTVQNVPVKGSRGVGVRVSTCTAAVTSRQRMIHTARRETGDNRYSLCLISELMRLHIRTQSVPACECFLVFLCALGHTTRVLPTSVPYEGTTYVCPLLSLRNKGSDSSMPSSGSPVSPHPLTPATAQMVGSQSTPCINASTGCPTCEDGIRPVFAPAHTNAVPRVPPSQIECLPPRRG